MPDVSKVLPLTALIVLGLTYAAAADPPRPQADLPMPPPAATGGPTQVVEALPPASTRPPLTLEELEAIALQNNPSMGRAVAAIQAARGNWLQVGMYPNPFGGF